MRACLVPLLAWTMVAGASGDHDQAYWLRERQEILPLEEVLRRLRLDPGVRILEVEREFSHGRHLYEIEYLGRGGRVREVRVDARTGARLDAEEEED